MFPPICVGGSKIFFSVDSPPAHRRHGCNPDRHSCSKRPELFEAFSDQQKIEYLEKLSNSMNHAAALIQKERDELGRLCSLKEGQIQKLTHAMTQNNAMLQQEVTLMNEERQGFNQHVAALNVLVKNLKEQLMLSEAQVEILHHELRLTSR